MVEKGLSVDSYMRFDTPFGDKLLEKDIRDSQYQQLFDLIQHSGGIVPITLKEKQERVNALAI